MKLLTCITFHFREHRLEYLRQVLAAQPTLADQVHVCIVTNTNDPEELKKIATVVPVGHPHCYIEMVMYPSLPHPWLLTWAHKPLMLRHYADDSFTHFMYIEDDLHVTRHNIDYWLRGRELLRPYRMYPSFLRVEYNSAMAAWVSSDVCQPAAYDSMSRATFADYTFVNFRQPYQGMFLYDRELMAEHIASPSFDIQRYGKLESLDNPDWGGGGSAENANFGLSFMEVPEGFVSRNLTGYLPKFGLIDPGSFVHHIPNNYADRPDTPHGKIALTALVVPA